MKPNWFVAAPVAGEWLPGWLADLPESCRSFQPVDLHMTVAFLGAMDPARLNDLLPVLQTVQSKPFVMSLGKPMALPSRKKFSAISLHVDVGHDEAAQLIGDFRNRLIDAVGGRQDHRPPLPHVTVGRPIRRFGHEGKQLALQWIDGKPKPGVTVQVDRLAVYTWAHDRTVQQFRTVAEHPLAVTSD